MNERIKQLTEQANVKPMYSPQGFDPRYLFEQEELEKFAELIIKECAKIAEKEQAYNDGHEIHVNIDQCILIEFGL
jgi:hypothetical protein